MPRISKPICWLAHCLIACAVSSVAALAAQEINNGDRYQGKLQQSALEAFAARSTAKVVWSKTVGNLESQEARATITALIVEDSTSKPNVMRGIRIDLAHIGSTPSCDWKYTAWKIMCKRANAVVYVEEGRLEVVRKGIKRGAAELRPMEFISRYSMNASGQVSTGLIICGYQFSNRQPGELVSLFTDAIGELKAASR